MLQPAWPVEPWEGPGGTGDPEARSLLCRNPPGTHPSPELLILLKPGPSPERPSLVAHAQARPPGGCTPPARARALLPTPAARPAAARSVAPRLRRLRPGADVGARALPAISVDVTCPE